MSTTPQRRGELWVLMQLRRLGLGRNPLRRRADRLESAVLLCALVAAQLVIPAAVAFGTTIRNRAEDTAARRRAELQPVQARTLEDTARATPSTLGQIATGARVQWFDASGSPREGSADILIGTEAGTELTIWLDRTGAMVRAPRESADSAAVGVVAGVTMLMLAWPFLWGLFRLARLLLDRRRAQDWGREWEQVSPRWTRTE
ncbi:hypothetical protein EV644_11743 [Kribbella orskensis]|uniref:Transmembrane protein n=1 Tax=Kribbella orskensis TaxID=2512216 RepID=A0ABY2BCM6_9ACTN|nr:MULTISPECIES: hypothetical protein [Kribbella]TCN35022.1 hypothetical protein EV642_11843 [Kribbella sp. VKM Ac-2500]TCO16389.1 hypothetical protein EV644_11743 [Kribbella orskensis]